MPNFKPTMTEQTEDLYTQAVDDLESAGDLLSDAANAVFNIDGLDKRWRAIRALATTVEAELERLTEAKPNQ